jgi:hypothetical protein
MRYETSVTTTVVTAAVDAVLAALRGESQRGIHLRELHCFTVTAPTTVGRLALKRALVPGATETGNSPVPQDPQGAFSTAFLSTGWGTTPTVAPDPAGALRRFACPAAVGNGIIWTWYEDDGLVIPPGGQICLCNAGATAPGTWGVRAVWEL